MLALVTVAVFVSSVVMFALEPMLAKMMLPHGGGGPSVWTACLVFFQSTLLLGYVASHVVVTRLGPKRQAVALCVALAVGLLSLPVVVANHATSSATSVVLALTVASGAPFFALSMTAPSLQRWYYEVAPSREPYSLFASSNVGCLLALIAYPLVEEHIGLRTQSRITAALYAMLIVPVALAAVRLWRVPVAPHDTDTDVKGGIPVAVAARWALLAFVPSAYLAAVTTHVTVAVSPIPLLWIVPLALYVATFVLAFGGATRAGAVAARALPFFVAGVVFTLLAPLRAFPLVTAAVHIAAFFVAALAGHTELARLRPPAPILTLYFVWIAVGGVAGSIFVALAAPVLFDQYLEYPLLVLGALVCLPSTKRSSLRWDFLFALGVAGTAWVTMTFARVLFPALPLASALVAMARPRRFALSIAFILGVGGVYADDGWTLWRERNFFGTLRVSRDASFVVLTNGTTVHGRQFIDPKRRGEPLAYYARSGPVQDVFSLAEGRPGGMRDVVVVGLGAGTLAAYARPQQRWSFIEIDPAAIAVAKNVALFTFLSDAFPSGDYAILQGDARVVLERWQGHADLLIMDAFSGDAIPTHLLTVEAGRLYAAKAKLVALHVSNRHARLSTVLARLARDLGWVAVERDDRAITEQDERDGKAASQWVLLAPDADALEGLARTWDVLRPDEQPAWTDDASSVLPILR